MLVHAQPGTSTQDRFGCVDADSDGWSDANDAFPTGQSQHLDTDGDGFGDAALGDQPDACPETAGTSTQDRFGCVDSDDDGWSDANDAFPEELTQHSDATATATATMPTASSRTAVPIACRNVDENALGCVDGDGDGLGGHDGCLPDDLRLWSDTDEDGYADQPGTDLSDDCPEVFGMSTKDALGCPDTDGDGWSKQPMPLRTLPSTKPACSRARHAERRRAAHRGHCSPFAARLLFMLRSTDRAAEGWTSSGRGTVINNRVRLMSSSIARTVVIQLAEFHVRTEFNTLATVVLKPVGAVERQQGIPR